MVVSVSIPTIHLPAGTAIPVLGLGTWRMGEKRAGAPRVAALRLGIELGMTLIDTAEMYGDGGAEEHRRRGHRRPARRVFIVSKVCPTTPRGAARSPPASAA